MACYKIRTLYAGEPFLVPLRRSPDRLSRQDIGDDLAILQDEDAVDESVVKAVVERCDIVPGGIILHNLGVKHRNVRVHADLQASLVGELGYMLAQCLGRNIGGVGDNETGASGNFYLAV